MFDVAHGAGLAAIWGSWARYVCKNRIDRFQKFALNVMEVEEGDDDYDTAIKGIVAMEDFYRQINMPTSMSELGISPTDEQIEQMAIKCDRVSNGAKTGSVMKLDIKDLINIYTMAK